MYNIWLQHEETSGCR